MSALFRLEEIRFDENEQPAAIRAVVSDETRLYITGVILPDTAPVILHANGARDDSITMPIATARTVLNACTRAPLPTGPHLEHAASIRASLPLVFYHLMGER